MKRRDFIKLSSAALAATSLPAFATGKTELNTGIQLFTIPQMVANDFKGTMLKLSDIGYKEIEFFGPYEFSAAETIEGWKAAAGQLGITKNAFYGYSIEDVKIMLADYGLSSPSVHLDLATLRTNLAPAMKALSSLGVKYAAIPTLADQADRTSIDRFKALADEFNVIGKKMADFGITFVYHNHGYEHWKKDGVSPMEILLKGTDAKYVAFEMDIFWLTAGGADPVEFLQKYPGRFKLMHVKDAKEKIRFSGDGTTFDQWMALFPKMADPGTGVMNVKNVIHTAQKSGTVHFFLERDLTPEPAVTLQHSFEYLDAVINKR